MCLFNSHFFSKIALIVTCLIMLSACNSTSVSEEQEKRYTDLKNCLQKNHETTSLMLSGGNEPSVNYDDVFTYSLKEYVEKHGIETEAIESLLTDLDLMCMSVNSYQMIEQDNNDLEEENPLP